MEFARIKHLLDLLESKSAQLAPKPVNTEQTGDPLAKLIATTDDKEAAMFANSLVRIKVFAFAIPLNHRT